METSSYNIQQITDQSWAPLSQLFKDVFNKDVPPEQLRFKYTRAPVPHRYSGFLARDEEGLVIGFCGGIPCEMQFQSHSVKGLQFCDTMTHPSWQGRGIFRALAQRLENWALEQKIYIHFAFLNQDSHWAYQKALGWSITTEIRRIPLEVTTVPWQKLGNIHPLLAQWQARLEQRVLRGYQFIKPFPNSLGLPEALVVKHDENFFQPRQGPAHQFLQISKSQIWLKSKRNLWVGDLQLHKSDQPEEIIKHLGRIAFWSGIHRIHLQFCAQSTTGERFSQKYEQVRSWSIGAKSHDLTVPVANLQLCLGDIDTF